MVEEEGCMGGSWTRKIEEGKWVERAYVRARCLA